jgi:nitrite reductase/ring-hydroxylating ferredoxin subunit
MKWYKIPGVQFTGEPFIKKIRAGNKNICLVGYEGKIFALGSTCPHAGEDLSRGWCKDGKLVCPVHRFSYTLETGKGSPGQNDFVESYAVKIKDGIIFIGVTGFWEKIKEGFR